MPDEIKKNWRILAAIAVATVVAYLPVTWAGFIWDDDHYVEWNRTLRSLGGLWDIWTDPGATPQYYPLVHTTYWLEFHLWGLDPLGYHLDNLLLHVASSVLLFVAIRRLALPGAALIAAVFALHPVMVESVAWVTERKNTLSMVFYLAALLAWLRFGGLGAPEATGPARPWFRAPAWWALLGLFALALASKSVTFSLPFTCLLILWWKRGRITWQDLAPLLPLIALGAAYGSFTSHLEHTQVQAVGPEWEQTVAERCLIAGRVPWFYLWKLLWPAELTFIYERWQVDATEAWQYGFPIATVVSIAALAFVARSGRRGPLAAVLMFGGTLFPALGFIAVYPFRYAYVADHFQYHASIGCIVLVGAWLARAVPRVMPAAAAWSLAALVLGLYGARTFVQCRKYESREVLYRSILADVPESWFACNNLAAIHVERKEFDRAFALYARARQLRPILAPAATPESYAHAMIGSVICQVWSPVPLLRAEQRVRRLQDELRIRDQAGSDTGALRRELGAAQAHRAEVQGGLVPMLQQAEDRMLQAIAISPDYANPRENHGELMRLRAQLAAQPLEFLEKAVQSWTVAVRLDPGSRIRPKLLDLLVSTAGELQKAGQGEAAAAYLQEAQRLELAVPARR